MSVDFSVTAESRADVGKGASRRLRHAGKIPGIIYGAGKDSQSLMLSHNEMSHHLEQEAFYSHILSVNVDGKAQQAVLKAVQRHPSKPRLLHIDFMRVGTTEKIHMHVPLHFIGEQIAPGVKEGSSIAHLMTGVDIACLAKNLPEYLEVDVSGMQTGDALHLSDIKLPTGVEIPALAQGADHDLPVVSVNKAKTKGGEDEDEDAASASAPADESEG